MVFVRILAGARDASAHAGAREVEREHPVACRAADGTVVSGTIDALVVEADGTPLVLDYKTEALAGRDAAVAAERYRPQLLAYAEGVRLALRRALRGRRRTRSADARCTSIP